MLKTFGDYRIELKPGASGEVKALCPQCSASRKKKNVPCLNVNVEMGVWNCWHCGWGGTLKTGQERSPTIKATYVLPVFKKPASGPSDAIGAWFAERGISAKTLERNSVTVGKIYFPQVEEERPAILFPYYRGDEVVNIKYRTRDKLFRMAAGAERILYGINDVKDVHETDGSLIWVEGEIDKLSVEEAGIISCVSVPDGAPAVDSKSYGSKFDFMAAPEISSVASHIIAVDSDGPGRKLEQELIRRLGAEKCLVVRWPEDCKDANDVLVKHGKEALLKAIQAAKPLPVQGAHTIAEFHDDFMEFYERGSQRGISTGWEGMDEIYTVREGDMTIITGIPGSGKSEWLDAMMVNLAASQGWNFGVFSAENWPITEHAKKLSEKFVGKPFGHGQSERISRDELEICEAWLSEHFHFVQPEVASVDSILSVMRQLVLRHGIKGMILDPWNEIEHTRPDGMNETEYVGKCLSQIRKFAREHLLAVWIVAHPTKLQKDKDGAYEVPTPYDISGSANWRNKADNCIAVWRDLSGGAGNDVEIHIQKIRHKAIGKIGMSVLRYDRITGEYHGASVKDSIYQQLIQANGGSVFGGTI